MGEPYCSDCPDHEACSTGYPCWKVKEIDQAFGIERTRDLLREMAIESKKEKENDG